MYLLNVVCDAEMQAQCHTTSRSIIFYYIQARQFKLYILYKQNLNIDSNQYTKFIILQFIL